MTQSIFQLMFVKAFGRIPSRRPGYCDRRSRGFAAAMFIITNTNQSLAQKCISADEISPKIHRKHGRGGAAGFFVTVSGTARRDPAERLHKHQLENRLGDINCPYLGID